MIIVFEKYNVRKFVYSLKDEEAINLYAALSMCMFPAMQRKDAIGSAATYKEVLRANLVKELTEIMNDGPHRVPLDLGY